MEPDENKLWAEISREKHFNCCNGPWVMYWVLNTDMPWILQLKKQIITINYHNNIRVNYKSFDTLLTAIMFEGSEFQHHFLQKMSKSTYTYYISLLNRSLIIVDSTSRWSGWITMRSLSFNEMAQAGPPARCLVQTHHLLRQPHNLSIINLRASRPRASQQNAKQPVSYCCAFCRDFRDFLQLFFTNGSLHQEKMCIRCLQWLNEISRKSAGVRVKAKHTSLEGR